MVTQSSLKSILKYNPSAGLFVWIVAKPGNARIGVAAGSQRSDGYIQISINGVLYLAHRLAWLYVYGEWPRNQIDHLNHNRADNRIANLREASTKENQRNQSIRYGSVSGVVGVTRHKSTGKWRAQIRVDGKDVHLGLYSSIKEAELERKDAEKKYNFHNNHGK